VTTLRVVSSGFGADADWEALYDAFGGGWDFELTFAPADVAASAASDTPSLFTALQEQLGLKLEATRAPAEVLVVDRIERPTPD
jgi:uncharacterized protein (TIGR03435 family)